MSRRRRAVLLLGLALALGGVAASDVAHREHALAARLGPAVDVLVARRPLPAGRPIAGAALGVRSIPARYAPVGAFQDGAPVVGARPAAAIPVGAFLTPAMLDGGRDAGSGPSIRPGERVAEVVATGSAALIAAGSHVDVLVTRDGANGGGRTTLALEDVEVLDVAAAPDSAGAGTAVGADRVRAALRVTVRQAVYLTAAQAFARELRLLPRAAGDRRHGVAGISYGAGR